MGYYDDVRDGLIPEDSPIHEQVKQFEKGVPKLFGGSLGTEPNYFEYPYVKMNKHGVPMMVTIETESGITTLNPKYVSAYTHTPIDETPYLNHLLVDIHMVSGTIFTAKMDAPTWNRWKSLRIGE